VRELPSGREYRHTRGFIGRPQTKVDASARDAHQVPNAEFTSDARFVVFTIEPTRAEVERAQHAKKHSRGPANALGILRTSDGNVTVIPGVKSFRLAPSGRYLAYLLDTSDTTNTQHAQVDSAPKTAASVPGGAPRPIASDSTPRSTQRHTFGSTLVLRDLSTGHDVVIGDVTAYTFDARSTMLGYTVASHAAETDGVYVRSLVDGQTTTLLSGRGRYRLLAFDTTGTRVAFISDRDEADRPRAHSALYYATLGTTAKRRTSRAAERRHVDVREVVTPAMLGDSLLVATTAKLEFSPDGTEIRFGVAPIVPDSVPLDSLADKAVFDLWNWRDARLQPEQRVDATRDRERSFPAVYLLDGGRLRVLGSDSLPRIRIAASGHTALASTDVPYRIAEMWGEGGYDLVVIDIATGARTIIKSRAPFPATLSPGGRYVLWFDRDAHWYAYSLASKRTVDLTGALTGVHFEQETWDRPSDVAPWGIAGWTSDDRSVLLYDRYDIWELDPSGKRSARIVTDSVGRRQHLVFRIADVDTTATLDASQSLLLHAVNDETMASGYWRDQLGADAPPVQLMMADRDVDNVRSAKNADVYLFTQGTFEEFPDLWVTNGRFASPAKISDANPQQRAYRWGTNALVHWRSNDGVPLKGILFKPADFDPAKKYPMVVYIYEQLSQNLHSYVPPAGRNIINPTVYVSNGYLVFEPDIHYETGYPGASALKSIVPGVQMLIDSGFVGPDAVGLQGQSWGGYQTAYVITQTSMFRAAMAGAPVANMTSAYGGIRWQTGLARAFQYEHTQSRIGGSIWEYPMRYLENSPLFSADRITTPLLIMSNDADGAVPWYQGIELFVAMRRLGKEVYLIDYNGEGHNPSKRANQLDIAMRMQQFFDHFLKGAPEPQWMREGIPFLEKGRDQIVTTPVQATVGSTSGEGRQPQSQRP
jgi:dipeptidyl aminopeptidase/acylaminoacyl peptidase